MIEYDGVDVMIKVQNVYTSRYNNTDRVKCNGIYIF